MSGRSEGIRGEGVRRETWTRRGRRRAMVGGAAVLLLLALSACGNLTAGGVAQAETVVTGDGSDGANAQAVASEGPSDQLPSDQLVQPTIEGSVTVRVAVYLVGPDVEPIDISGGVREVTLDIHGETSVSLGAFSIPPDTYAGLRVVFSEVEADVTYRLGGILPILETGIVTVDFGGASTIQVERPMVVTVDEDEGLVATVDLRAPSWIQTVVGIGVPWVVPAGVFMSMVQLTLE